MSDTINTPIEHAHQKRQQGEFQEAGEYYTTGSFRILGEGPPNRFATRYGKALYHLLLASTCLAMAGDSEWSTNRRDIGVVLADELAIRTRNPASKAPYDRARSSAWYEYAGDLFLITSDDQWKQYYEKARTGYEGAGNPPFAHREQEHMYLRTFFEYVLREVEMYPAEMEEIRQEGSLTDWLDLKQEVLPDGIELLIEGSTWRFPGEK